MRKKFEIISRDYYSNCMIEAVKAKVKDWKHVKITYVSPWNNLTLSPHFLWSDGENDYDFGHENGEQGLRDWTIHKGHIRKHELGYNQRYLRSCSKWRKRQREKRNKNK